MKAVYSHWSRVQPIDQLTLKSLLLSAYFARKLFGRVEFVGDSAACAVVEPFRNLLFDRIDPLLDSLHADDPRVWTLGKLETYSHQNEPFIHIDADVFMQKPLPEYMLSAALFCERFDWHFGRNSSPYRLDHLERNGVEFDAVMRAASELPVHLPFVMGIFGGRSHAQIREYARSAIAWARANDWSRVVPTVAGVVVDQYYLWAWTVHTQTRVSTLLLSEEGNLNEMAEHAGYTHLLGYDKRRPEYRARVDERLHDELPQLRELIQTACEPLPAGHTETDDREVRGPSVTQEVMQSDYPRVREQARNFLRAARDEAGAIVRRDPAVTEAEQQTRWDACAACEHFVSKSKRCKKCGCMLKTKIRWRSQHCPIGRW